MSENNGKKEITRIEPCVPYDAETDVVTYIGCGRGAEVKYGIRFPVPTNDEESKDRYNCSLNDLVKMGVQKIATSPNYPTVMFDDDGDLVDGGHEAGQKLADEYKVGVRASGTRVTAAQAKKKADAAEAVAINLAEQCGMSEEAVAEMIRQTMASKEAESSEE